MKAKAITCPHCKNQTARQPMKLWGQPFLKCHGCQKAFPDPTPTKQRQTPLKGGLAAR